MEGGENKKQKKMRPFYRAFFPPFCPKAQGWIVQEKPQDITVAFPSTRQQDHRETHHLPSTARGGCAGSAVMWGSV